MPYSRILIGTEELQRTVSSLARKINSAFEGIDNCVALVILDGAKYFAEDLLAKLNFPFEVESIKASSYSGTNSTGMLTTSNKEAIKEKMRGKNILLVEDIYDSGLTLSHILEWIDGCQPKSVRTCVLLEKEVGHAKKIDIDFLGTKIGDLFAIGYGLDFEGQYRELPFIGELSADIIKQNNPAYNP